MDPTAHFAQRHHQSDMDDLVATFVENELGRHDWLHNWPVWKLKNQDYLSKIRSYFHQLGEDVNLEEVARYIDQMIITRPGRWR